MSLRMVVGCLVLLWMTLPEQQRASAAEAPTGEESLRREFQMDVLPFLQSYCVGCHGGDDPDAKLDLQPYRSFDNVTDGLAVWMHVLDRLEAGDMPPADADVRPTDDVRRNVVKWIRAVRSSEAAKRAGDPGTVLAHRLSNAEYDNTIRDLTGVDIRPTSTFPVDPANEAGFDNSGESLTMSPALLKKYLEAARFVTEHLVLKPDGFEFAPHPVVTETDRDKYCVKRIVAFYQQQPTHLADYFDAAYLVQDAVGGNAASTDDADSVGTVVKQVASEQRISARYLATVFDLLTQDDLRRVAGPVAALRAMFNERRDAGAMSDFVRNLRYRLQPRFENITVQGGHKGSQQFVLWKNRQYAAYRQKYDAAKLFDADGGDVPEGTPVELFLPSDESARVAHLAAMDWFCRVFPDEFYVSERGRDYVDKPRDEQEKGRLLSAGFHSMMGYFRDDGPLCELILDDVQKQELDALWLELDFVTSAPMRQYAGFLWFERTDSQYMRDPEFDFARAEDKSAASNDMIERLSVVYLNKARHNGGSDVVLQAIVDYFKDINRQIRRVEQARLDAEPSHLAALLNFAERACRRPLTNEEQRELLDFYHASRAHGGNDGSQVDTADGERAEELSHEDAMRDCIAFVLMSPRFLYRLDASGSGESTQRLTDYELASRLSYFLWSSMPDEELLALAASGRLHESEVLRAQTRRMLQDDRVRGLATEFVGNWLDFRRFESHNSVDRGHFPQFTDSLRQAMFEEPVRFFMNVTQQDRSILQILDSDSSFVNQELAEHYGLATDNFASDEWRRVDGMHAAGRGGFPAMSVFLTMNSPGLRTSPVKRGYWIVRRLLGERIPAPPPNVPELPADESSLGELSLRDVLAKHREHSSCAGCHERFDSIGLVFEGFGPIGERRARDLGNRPVDDAAVFPDGVSRSGVTGLREYLLAHRQDDFVEHFCRSLVPFALGRMLQISDESLIEEMHRRLEENNHQFSVAVEAIVESPQFLNRRTSSNPTAALSTESADE